MATNSQIAVTEGSGKNIASYSFTETTTKELQRHTLNDSSGAEMGIAALPLQVSLANNGANSTAVKVDNSAVTQPVTGLPAGATAVVGVTGAITDTTSTSCISAGAGAVKIYVTSILITNSHATVGTFVKVLDGSTIIWEGYAAAVGGGFASHFPVPLVGTAATAINIQPVTTGANVIGCVSGYKL